MVLPEIFNDSATSTLTVISSPEVTQPYDGLKEPFASSIFKIVSRSEASVEESTYAKEIELYFTDSLIPEEMDPLEWWRSNTFRYPKLSQMARDILSAPASSVASESAFSTSGRVISD